MAPFRTAFNGYAVKFSPFEEGRIAVATSQNFGIIGNGRQYVLQVGISICTRKALCFVMTRLYLPLRPDRRKDMYTPGCPW